MNTMKSLQETFRRIQVGTTVGFTWIRMECGSWKSAYEYMHGESPLGVAEVARFKADVKELDNVKWKETGKGHIVIEIKVDILKTKGMENEQVDAGRKGYSKGSIESS